MKDRMPARMLTLGAIDGAGTGAYIAAVSIILTLGSGPGAAAAVLATGSAGRIASLAWLAALTRGSRRSGSSANRAYTAATVLMTFGALLGIHAAQNQALAAAALLGVVSGAGNSLTTTLAATARRGQMTSFYPLLMIGGAAGAAWSAAVLHSGRPVIYVQALIALQIVEPVLIRPYRAALRRSPPVRELLAGGLRGVALATLAYGPLTTYAVLTTLTVGVQHVGASMAFYAAGASLAAAVDSRLRLNPVYAADRWGTTVMLAAAGIATWAAAASLPGLLAGRFVAGLLTFLAQGRMLRRSYEQGAEAGVAGTTTGLSIGGGIGGVIAGSLVGSYSIASMSATLTLATLTLAFLRYSSDKRG